MAHASAALMDQMPVVQAVDCFRDGTIRHPACLDIAVSTGDCITESRGRFRRPFEDFGDRPIGRCLRRSCATREIQRPKEEKKKKREPGQTTAA